MTTDPLKNPELQSGHSADEASVSPKKGPPVNKTALAAEDNRGKRAPQSGSGAVIGSGAGAGGRGGAEDFDSDPAGGGGTVPSPEDDHPNRGADAPIGGSR